MLRSLRKWWWPAAIVVLAIWPVARWAGCVAQMRETQDGVGCACQHAVRAPEPPAGLIVAFPTAQTNLWKTNDASVFMPTQSGRVQSALYGSTRTRLHNGRAIPAFHEGIDIAPMRRDAAGRALDDVFAIADGVVGYANRAAGASSYGRYVVIEHEDARGPIYSLYSHLASVPDTVRDGASIDRGAVVGRMGSSSSLGIPRARAHLHFEVGLMLNRRFDAWLRKHKMEPRHGIHHGWNLTGIDPLALYPTTDREQRFSIFEHLAGLPVAFELMLRGDRPLDYFARYAALWKAETPPEHVSVLSVSDGGVIVAGRVPTQDERARLGARDTLVLRVDADVLGQNGPGLIATTRSGWELTRKGRRWAEILLH
jgi:peptidoglycan LD-endopeptidase LytH